MEQVKSFYKEGWRFALHQVSPEAGKLFPEWKEKFFLHASPRDTGSKEYVTEVMSLHKANEIVDRILSINSTREINDNIIAKLFLAFAPPLRGEAAEGTINPYVVDLYLNVLRRALVPFKDADRKKLFEVFCK